MSDQITGHGNAPSTIKVKNSVMNNFNEFLQFKNYPKFPLPESNYVDNDDDSVDMNPTMSKEFFCREELMYEYSYYLVKINKSKMHKNEELMLRTVKEYMRKVMQNAKLVFGEDGVGDFFRGQEKDCPKDYWWKKLIENLERNIARRCIDNEQKLTDSPPSLARRIMILVGMAYISAGTQESLLRRLILVLVYMVCGRAGEVATTTWKLVVWDYTLGMLYFDWSMPKTGKQKGIMIVPDSESYAMDLYKAFGDCFIAGSFQKYR